MDFTGWRPALPREVGDLIPCEVCEEPTLVGDDEHCPYGECGAGARCREHRCLCGSPDLKVPCECGSVRSRHLDDPDRAGTYSEQCDDCYGLADGEGCAKFRPIERLADAVPIEILEADGQPGEGSPCTWGEFRADNAEGCDDSLLPEIEAALSLGRDYVGGGGAAPEFTVRLVRS